MSRRAKVSVRDRLRAKEDQLKESEKARAALTGVLLGIITAADGHLEIPNEYLEEPEYESASFVPGEKHLTIIGKSPKEKEEVALREVQG